MVRRGKTGALPLPAPAANPWGQTGGYTYLHRNVPMYSMGLDRAAAQKATDGFNYVMLNRSSIPDFAPDYVIGKCFGPGKDDDVCAIHRPRACIADIGVKPLLALDSMGEPAFETPTPEPYKGLRRPSPREFGPWMPPL